MLRCNRFGSDFVKPLCKKSFNENVRSLSKKSFPTEADVVIIGGGSAGCHTLYHLAKRGIKAVLLERAKLTAGTTWHTSGLVWSLRPSDTDIELLASSRRMLANLQEETGVDPGWIQNGGLFIAHEKNRLDEYKRLATLGKCFNIESQVLSANETLKVFPLLDPKSFLASLYSPGDGVVDPSMLCASLTKYATTNGGRVIENCSVNKILAKEEGYEGKMKIYGVETNQGTISTNVVVNATGAWGNDLMKGMGINLPLVLMRHAYVVSEPMDGVQGLPNVRDHDASIYLRIQGNSIQMGGYETNPIFIDDLPQDFQFSLYDLDYNTFETHVAAAEKLCPAWGRAGVRSTVCGPESFTPDHKPLVGPDSKMQGLFHNCGHNSAGMMFGGGIAEQLAKWIVDGTPDLHMFPYDIRRFTSTQRKNNQWARERSHESYATNYSMIFLNDQPLAGRDIKVDSLHKQMLNYGAFMQEYQGWEIPSFFLKDQTAPVMPYDYYGNYGVKANKAYHYADILKGDLKYGFSDHHKTIEEEAMSCRTNAVVFNRSNLSKLFITGPDAQAACDWLFTNGIVPTQDRAVYTLCLNDMGGIMATSMVTTVSPGTGLIYDPIFKGTGFYVTTDGSYSNHMSSYVKTSIAQRQFDVSVNNVTESIGVLSIQGPNSRKILQKLTKGSLDDSEFPAYGTKLMELNAKYEKENVTARVFRISEVGELGFELHVDSDKIESVYNALMEIGGKDNLRNAGYRAFYSLSCEKGIHRWGTDLRTNDTPVEARLMHLVRKSDTYRGHAVVNRQQEEGIHKKSAYFTISNQVPLWGMEGVYRNRKVVGYIRRGDYSYTLQRPVGSAYIRRPSGREIDDEWMATGDYQIDVMGKLYNAQIHLKAPLCSH